MVSTVIGGAMLPHAPQFFTMPETEDKANVERVRAVAREIGDKLKAMKPDLWIIFSNDHAEQFFHNVAPPFTIHVGGEATGDFAGRKFHWKIPSEIGFELVRELYRQNFDPAFTSTAKIDYAIGIPLTHIGLTDPVLPIFVNAYLPPQPTPERCYAFGQAVARSVGALGLKTVILASGGMSHFPGTNRYGNPGARLGQPAVGKARGRQAEIPDRLRRDRARRHRQYRAAVLGLRRRRARRAQARHRVDGSELAPQLRLARLDRRGAGPARCPLSRDQAGARRTDRGAAWPRPRAGQARALRRGRRGLCEGFQADGGAGTGAAAISTSKRSSPWARIRWCRFSRGCRFERMRRG